jgi:hypothetical protein
MADGNVSATQYQKGEGICEPVPPKKSTGLYFHSHGEARLSVGRRKWVPPRLNATIPMTYQAKGVWVLALLTAMENMSDYVDGQGPKMQTRWFDSDWVAGDVPPAGAVLTNP